MTVNNLMELNFGLRLVCGRSGGNNEIKYVDVVEIPGGAEWTTTGDFVITTGYFFKDDPAMLAAMIAKLTAKSCAGLGIKLDKYGITIDESIKRLADENRFPILKIHVDSSYRDIQQMVNARIIRETGNPGEYGINDRKSLYTHFITQKAPSSYALHNLASSLRIEADAPRYVMTAPAGSMMTEITYDFPNMTLINNPLDGIVAGIWDCQDENLRSEMKKAASAFANTCRFKVPSIGVSSLCTQADGLRSAYMDALFAMHTGHITEPNIKLHYYTDYYLHRLILDNWNHPAVEEASDTFTRPLLVYDAENGAELLKTLWAMCKANFNMQRACQELNIHRNTLYVRMERIRVLTGFDVDSYISRQSAHMAVLYELIEKNHHK